MSYITLAWIESGQPQTHTFQATSASPSTLRIGRDPNRCDWVLHHPTVSGLHVELFLTPHGDFGLRTLRPSNPPLVNDHPLLVGEQILAIGSQIRLGEVTLQVIALETDVPPVSDAVSAPPRTQLWRSVNMQDAVPFNPGSITPVQSEVAHYGLECPSCKRVSDYDRTQLGCAWCGTSLAAAVSLLLPPLELRR